MNCIYTHTHTHTHICTYIYKGLFNHEKEGNPALGWIHPTQVDLEGIMLSKISQTEKERYCMAQLLCGI